jgi:hypothetical protein
MAVFCLETVEGVKAMKKMIRVICSMLLLSSFLVSVSDVHLQTKKEKTTTQRTTSTATQPLNVVVARTAPANGNLFEKASFPSKEEVEAFQNERRNKAQKAYRFRKFREMLLSAGVPFEPNLLLEKNWQEIIKKNYGEYFNSLNSRYVSEGKISGAVLADTLYLPKKVRFEKETIILANQIVFEGDDVVIKGHADIMIMTMERTLLTKPTNGRERSESYQNEASNKEEFKREFFSKNKIAEPSEEILKPINGVITIDASAGKTRGNIRGASGKLYKPAGYITIDASGFGNKEWKELKEKNEQGLDSTIDKDKSGFPGADGGYPTYPKGARGRDGEDGRTGGEDGSCIASSSPNGRNGDDGNPGGAGEQGDPAPNDATAGEAGRLNEMTINQGDTNDYHFISNGGDGGKGQRGAIGGDGGTGGKGKKGGDGATCGCTVGNGGNSGKGGKGGDGGAGGNGGKGANGGNGKQPTEVEDPDFEGLPDNREKVEKAEPDKTEETPDLQLVEFMETGENLVQEANAEREITLGFMEKKEKREPTELIRP